MSSVDRIRRVADGAAFLDDRSPGWAAKIDPDRLAMSDDRDDILGQIYGDYDEAVETLGIDDPYELGLSDTETGDCWKAEVRKRLVRPLLVTTEVRIVSAIETTEVKLRVADLLELLKPRGVDLGPLPGQGEAASVVFNGKVGHRAVAPDEVVLTVTRTVRRDQS